MDRFHEMQVFLAVAEEEGFAAAARRLKTSPPSVTRAIAAMEERIGTQLLARTTRSLHLTEAGQRYLEDCRRILAELDEAEEAAAGSYSIPCGHLTVTAPVLFGELYVAPVLGEYLDRFPLVNINALLVDRVVNMTDEASGGLRSAGLSRTTRAAYASVTVA
jgi:DNA-binding transcriptional LysR family regulator